MAGDDNLIATAAGQGSKSETGFFYGYVIVMACFLISVAMWSARLSFGVFIGPLLDEFGWSRGLTSAAFSLTYIGAGLLSILVGRLNDRFGPRVIMTVAGCFLGLGYYLTSTLSNITQLFLYYGVINIGMSAVLIPIMATIARWFVKMRAFMSGIVLVSNGVALLFVVPMANRFIVDHGWRLSYQAGALISVIVITVSAQFLIRDPFQVGKLPYGYEPPKADLSAGTVFGLTLKESLCTLQLYLLAVAFGCTYLLYYMIIGHFVLFATGIGFSLDRAVAVISVLGLAGIPGRVLMGIFGDRMGHKRAVVTSATLMIISFFCLLVSNRLWVLILFAILFGFGHGGMATMQSPITAYIFGMRAHGSILGVIFTGDTIGGALGAVVAGYVFDLTRSYGLAFKIAFVITLINLSAILLLKPVKERKKGFVLSKRTEVL